MAKIGDVEIPDEALESFFKKQGRRLVEESDYLKKSEAANDLAKWRAVTGENRSLDEVAEMVKKAEEAEKKNKTEAELLKAELDKIKEARKSERDQLKKLSMEVRSRAIKDYFDAAANKLGVKVIEPILEKRRQKFLEVDDSKMSKDELFTKVSEEIKEAYQEQVDSLKSLGIGDAPETETPFSAGGGFYQMPAPGKQIPGGASPDEVWKVLNETAASVRTAGFDPLTPTPISPPKK